MAKTKAKEAALISRKSLQKIFTRARDLLQENGWIQDCAAINKDGNSVPPEHADAVKFCAIGSIDRAIYELEHHPSGTISPIRNEVYKCFTTNATIKPIDDIAEWNDVPSRRRSDVVKAFDRVITHLHPKNTTKSLQAKIFPAKKTLTTKTKKKV